jgi:hypothetical protein
MSNQTQTFGQTDIADTRSNATRRQADGCLQDSQCVGSYWSKSRGDGLGTFQHDGKAKSGKHGFVADGRRHNERE